MLDESLGDVVEELERRTSTLVESERPLVLTAEEINILNVDESIMDAVHDIQERFE